MEEEKENFSSWLRSNIPHPNIKNVPPKEQQRGCWTDIRLYISSTLVDTQSERNALIQRVIPNINMKLAPRMIRIVPIDYRWGCLLDENTSGTVNIQEEIQRVCLNFMYECRQDADEAPWFIAIATERYGWIQDFVTPVEHFKNPESVAWLGKLKESGKHIAITNIEWINACVPPKQMRGVPTVFYYKRHIDNSEDIEPNLSWVFDFDYVQTDTVLDPEVQYQYRRSDNANAYRDDKDQIQAYLQTLDHVKWTKYNCHYEKGGAVITMKREGQRSFGIGYVEGLSEFEEMIEKDLMEAVERNFTEATVPDVPEFILETIHHEDTIKLSVSKLFGREELLETTWHQCTSPSVSDSVMMIYGEPGCDKSAILAVTATRCMAELRTKGDFIFLHSVTYSNFLDVVFKRLQLNLRKYRKELGEENIDEECSKSVGRLKTEHLGFLTESAIMYPDKKFIIFVDGVDHLRNTLQARKMWWLPSKDVPTNLRIIITTRMECDTFDNVSNVCPNAVKLQVGEMSYQSRKEMVEACMMRVGKKLTTRDDPVLGNQMEDLLKKNESPLYLRTAVEVLRRFGIYEQVKEYMQSLPNTISELFGFKLDEWSAYFGKRLTQDVTSLICLSKDGLLINEINDILRFKEEREYFTYDASFSHFYDPLTSFLVGGGGGGTPLRLFHEDLKFELKKKFLSPEVEQHLHRLLECFFLTSIRSQLCENPCDEPPPYYNHSLDQLVYHQLQLTPENGKLGDFKDSLRNIYFVRERVKKNQQGPLNHEYLDAIKRSSDDEEIEAFKQWSKFIQLYSDVADFSKYCYSMAVNQAPTSYVSKDTKKLPVPDAFESYPLYWTNVPSAEDAIEVKYLSEECYDGVASNSEDNLCCFTAGKSAYVFEQTSGDIIQEVKVESYAVSVLLSTKRDMFWIGDRQGNITLYNIYTGHEEWKEVICEKPVIWMESTGEFIVCGTGEFKYGAQGQMSTISLIDEEKRKVIRSWKTMYECYSYCFHANQKLIFSGHNDFIIGWTLHGELSKIFYSVGSSVTSLDAHPEDDVLLSASSQGIITQWNMSTGKDDWSITGSGTLALYDYNGSRILSTSPSGGAIRIYGLNGILKNEIKGHTEHINKISLIPGSNKFLTAAFDGSSLFNLSKSASSQESDEEKIWCDFLIGGEEFATLSLDLSMDGVLRIWESSSCTPRISINTCFKKVCHNIKGLIHPKGNIICIVAGRKLSWYKTANLELVSSFTALKSEKGAIIADTKISPNGLKMVITALRLAIVFDISDIKDIKECLRYRGHSDTVAYCDIHTDNVQVVTGAGDSIHIWDISTGEMLWQVKNRSMSCFVKFLPGTDKLLHQGPRGTLYIRDLREDINIVNFPTTQEISSAEFLRNGSQLMTIGRQDGIIRIFDVSSSKCVYTFFDHRALKFISLAVHPSDDMVIAGNKNGLLYALKNKRKVCDICVS